METTDLYSSKDTRITRELLTNEQRNLCAITQLPIQENQHILEHAHDNEMFIRGVTSRQANSALGVCENMWIRYMKWWYPRTLPEFLRELADYIERNEKKPDVRFRHNSWQKKVKTEFNKLSASQQNKVLIALGAIEGSNPAKRKELFSKAILDRSKGFMYIVNVINQVKGK